ncbi:MAG: sensor histidine kinase, partial [Actinocatenispora sp.]
PENLRARIFEPFYRAPGAPNGGSGLGLAIARGFIEANGGEVEVESLPGQGSSFVVTFVTDADPPSAVPYAGMPAIRNSGKGGLA